MFYNLKNTHIRLENFPQSCLLLNILAFKHCWFVVFSVESLLQPQFVFASRTHLDVYPFNFPDRDQTEIEMNGASNRMYGSQWHYYTNVAFNSKAKMLYASDTRYRTIFSWNNAPNPNGWVIWEYFIRGIDNIRGKYHEWHINIRAW